MTMSLSRSLSIKSSPWRAMNSVDEKASSHRVAAASASPTILWCGSLVPQHDVRAAFSPKVFIGGVPWDITEDDLRDAMGKFGPMKFEWPLAFPENPGYGRNARGTGYVYVIFDNDKSVKQLLGYSNYEFSNGCHNFFFKVSSSRMKNKMVQVIPWQVNNSNYIRPGASMAMSMHTVFVGSLHGMISAHGLAVVMNDLFGGVMAASIDIDKYKYPIGSGRVTFCNTASYHEALKSCFVELRTQKFSKKIQIDPFLEDSICNVCGNQVGDLFCREAECFKYFCRTCWTWQHHSTPHLDWHMPVMRHPRNNPVRLTTVGLEKATSFDLDLRKPASIWS